MSVGRDDKDRATTTGGESAADGPVRDEIAFTIAEAVNEQNHLERLEKANTYLEQRDSAAATATTTTTTAAATTTTTTSAVDTHPQPTGHTCDETIREIDTQIKKINEKILVTLADDHSHHPDAHSANKFLLFALILNNIKKYLNEHTQSVDLAQYLNHLNKLINEPDNINATSLYESQSHEKKQLIGFLFNIHVQVANIKRQLLEANADDIEQRIAEAKQLLNNFEPQAQGLKMGVDRALRDRASSNASASQRESQMQACVGFITELNAAQNDTTSTDVTDDFSLINAQKELDRQTQPTFNATPIAQNTARFLNKSKQALATQEANLRGLQDTNPQAFDRAYKEYQDALKAYNKDIETAAKIFDTIKQRYTDYYERASEAEKKQNQTRKTSLETELIQLVEELKELDNLNKQLVGVHDGLGTTYGDDIGGQLKALDQKTRNTANKLTAIDRCAQQLTDGSFPKQTNAIAGNDATKWKTAREAVEKSLKIISTTAESYCYNKKNTHHYTKQKCVHDQYNDIVNGSFNPALNKINDRITAIEKRIAANKDEHSAIRVALDTQYPMPEIETFNKEARKHKAAQDITAVAAQRQRAKETQSAASSAAAAAPAAPAAPAAHQSTSIKKSFWQRHRKKILVGAAIGLGVGLGVAVGIAVLATPVGWVGLAAAGLGISAAAASAVVGGGLAIAGLAIGAAVFSAGTAISCKVADAAQSRRRAKQQRRNASIDAAAAAAPNAGAAGRVITADTAARDAATTTTCSTSQPAENNIASSSPPSSTTLVIESTTIAPHRHEGDDTSASTGGDNNDDAHDGKQKAEPISPRARTNRDSTLVHNNKNSKPRSASDPAHLKPPTDDTDSFSGFDEALAIAEDIITQHCQPTTRGRASTTPPSAAVTTTTASPTATTTSGRRRATTFTGNPHTDNHRAKRRRPRQRGAKIS